MNWPAIAAGHAQQLQKSPHDTQELHGVWLLIARVGWLVLALGILALNIVMLPQYLAMRQIPCAPGPHCFYLQLTPYDLHLMQQTGLTRAFMADYDVWVSTAAMLVFYAIAMIIVLRRSSDRMALFCAYTLMLFGGVVFSSTLQDTLAMQSSLGFWLFGILFTLAESSFLVFLLIFPNGRFAPRWTRWLVPVIVAYWMYDFLSNHIYDKDFNPSTFLFFVILLSPLAVQIYRYRRVSTLRERQQTKWVVFGIAIALIGFVLFLITGNLISPPEVLQSNVLTVFVAQTGFAVFLLLIPISIAIAILRSRLYGIDVLINRTLVYGSLTAILALIYVAGVVGAQTIVNVFARNPRGDTAPVLVVITTLVIAALFQPLRRRIQRAIDRRFYRRKYNVEQTLSAFSATLRQEVNLSDLSEHLLLVVQQTMEPDTLSLWLRPPTNHP